MQLRPLTAKEEILTPNIIAELVPSLLQYPIPAEDALALAHSLALLFRAGRVSPPIQSPLELLSLYSLNELAAFCEDYYTRLQEGQGFGVSDSHSQKEDMR